MSETHPSADSLQRKSLAQQIAENLRSAIFAGRIPGGTVLRQSVLAAEFGVSVIPLREALRQLEGEGLLRQERHHGAVVADLSADDVEELVNIFHALEAVALPRAMPRMTEADLELARAALEGMHGEKEIGAFASHMWDFKRALLCRAESPRLLSLLELLHKSARRYVALFLQDPEARAMMLRHFSERLELARARDLQALLRHGESCFLEGTVTVRRLLPPSQPASSSSSTKKRTEEVG
jgi:DNA-binding GntR family transcriptional regulator